MLLSVGELALVSITVLLLLLSGLWTDRRFARFNQLPAHYGLNGKPTRFASRRTMAWLTPATFSVMLIAITSAIAFVPSELRNGDPKAGTIIMCLSLLTAQCLILWLHVRWAREQD